MTIENVWYDSQKNIIHQIYDGSWTWDDFYKAFYEIGDWKESVDHPVHLIIDLRNSNVLPDNAFTHIRGLHRRPSQHKGMTVLVTTSFLVLRLNDIFKMIMPNSNNFRIVDTLEDALLVINALSPEAVEIAMR